MEFKDVKFLLLVSVLVLVLWTGTEGKRGGRRGGVYKGSSNVWGRSRGSHGGSYDTHRRKQKTSGSESEPRLDSAPTEFKKLNAPAPKKATASAPPSPKEASKSMIDHERSQGANQRPIGWDVGQSGAKPKPGAVGADPIQKQTSSVNQAAANPSYPVGQQHSPPAYNAPGPSQAHPSYGQAPPPYTPHGQAPPPHNYGQPPPPYSHGAPPPHYQPGGYPQGGYNQGMGGYGHHPAYGAPGGGHQYGSPGYGMGGMGGMGGFGGFGGYGGGGFMKPSTGFGGGFAKHAVMNIAGGLLIWHLISGITRRPYEVHNYYNRPDDVPREMTLPANVITMCPEKVTELCAPNTIPLCTANSTIMCAVDADKTVPCQGNLTGHCISSTPPCDEPDGNCSPTKADAATPISIPCIANATIDGKVEMQIAPGALGGKGGTVLCITTIAVPQPEDSDPCRPGVEGVNGTSPCIALDQTPPPPPPPGQMDTTTKEPILNAKIIIPPPSSTTISSSTAAKDDE